MKTLQLVMLNIYITVVNSRMVRSKSECDNNAIIKLHEIMCRFINSNLSRPSIYSYNNNRSTLDMVHEKYIINAIYVQ